MSAAVNPRPVSLASVIVSEWTKLRTLRSTLWSLLAAVFSMAVLRSAVAAVQMSRWSQLAVERAAQRWQRIADGQNPDPTVNVPGRSPRVAGQLRALCGR